MQDLQKFLQQAEEMRQKNQQLEDEIDKLNDENELLTNKNENLTRQLTSLKSTDWLIENGNLRKENERLKQEKQKAVTNSRSITTKAQTLISDNEKKRNDLDYQLKQVRNKEIEIDSRIQKEAARKAEKIAADKKRRLQQQYSDLKRGLREKEDELEEKFRKLVTLLVTGAAVLGLVVGFVAHTGRVKVQAWHIDRLAKKLDQTKDTVEKQEKKIDKLQYMDEATLERKINAIDQISYIVNDPVVSESARSATRQFVNKKELRELKRELDRSRKAGKVGWWSYQELKTKLDTSSNYVS